MAHQFAIAAAAILFSTGGTAIKLSGLDGWQVAGARSAIAALVIWVAVPAARGGRQWQILPVAASYAATMILFVLGNKLTTAAHTTFLQSTAPLYLLGLGPWVLGEPVRRSSVTLMGALAVGLPLLLMDVGDAGPSAPDPGRGNLIAAAAGVSWALTLLGLRWLQRREAVDGDAGLSAVVVGNVMAAGVAAPWAFPLHGTATDALIVTYLGVVQVGLAYLLLTFGLRRVGALEASLLVLLEPTLNPAWAWLVHDEAPGGPALAGGALIVTATALRSWLDRSASERAGRYAAARPPPRR